jgi:S-adenosylmethionine hydrolase
VGRRYDTVSFLSDYGTADEYVGVVKAVIRDLAPHATVVDLTHSIDPFDVRAGSLALVRAIGYVPAGVILATVDPGVGTARRAIAVEVAEGAGVVVGPDNGLLAPAIAVAGGAGRAVVLTAVEYQLDGPGVTSSGRDVFAPVAAHLCNGVDLAEFGELIDPALLLPSVIPLPRQEGERLLAEVLWVDRFGNVQLNVGPEDVAGAWGAEWTRAGEARIRVIVGEEVRAATVTTAFGDLVTGSLGLVLDGSGMYSGALDRASAAAELRVGVTDQVGLEPLGVEAPHPRASIETPVTLRPNH